MKTPIPITERLSDLKALLNNSANEISEHLNAITKLYTIDDIKRLEYIYKVIEIVLNTTTMENARFDTIGVEPLPKSEKETDEFIKKRVRLWMNTWVRGPLQSILDEREKDWIK